MRAGENFINPDRRRRRARGFEKERDLVRKLWKLGFACMRAPASGAKVRRAIQPDIVAVRNGFILIMEVKSRRECSTVYVDGKQIEKIKEWEKRAGPNAIAMVAIYAGREIGWRFLTLDKAEVTEGGNYKFTPQVIKGGLDLNQLRMITESNVGKIDSFCDKNQR